MDIFTDSHVMDTPPDAGSYDTMSRPPSHHDVLALQSRLDDALRRNRELQARNQELEAQYKEFYRDRTQIVSKANYYEAMFNRTREKRDAARAEARHYRKLARKPLALQEKVDRLLELLELLDETDITPGKTVSVAVLCHHVAKLQAELKKYRVQYSCFSQALFGRRSEKQDKKPSSRTRGQQPGGKGHGRTQRPDLETTEERHEPPADALTCSQCNAPYGANGTHQSDIIEIEVKAHTRRIIRPRYRRRCTCSGPPVEVSAPPPVRLFPNTPFGISVWTRVLCERFVSMRMAHRPGARDLTGHAGRWSDADAAPVRTAPCRHSCPPEHGNGPECRRDRLACARVDPGGSLQTCLAVGLCQSQMLRCGECCGAGNVAVLRYVLVSLTVRAGSPQHFFLRSM